MFNFIVAIMFNLFSGEIKSPIATTVKGFELSKYLGHWYEIARFDHSFERNMDSTTAQYSLSDKPGIVKVLNRGYRNGKWSDAIGRAKVVDADTGLLKVAFFMNFYAPYQLILLDKDYQWSVVSSGKKYLWILSRTKTIEPELLNRLLGQIREMGFDTQNLIFPKQ